LFGIQGEIVLLKEATYMLKKYLKAMVVLAVLLISLTSISSAAGPLARPDLYRAQCGVRLDVPATAGLLVNDITTNPPLTVSSNTPLAGLVVDADGSFVYDPPANMPSGSYVYFYYRVTDNSGAVSNQALVKIAVSCICRGAAPDITVCPGTVITPELVISNGAGCIGCRDATPKIDLSKIPAQPVAGQCYPYTVACPACQLVTGQVCFMECDDNDACTIDTCDPATGCVHTQIDCNDNNACTTDTCDSVDGCVNTQIDCDDQNACTTDTCDPVTGCEYTDIVCNDNDACTTDTCDPVNGCEYTDIVCNDNDACTTDTCDPVNGCEYTDIVCNDNDACTTDTCDPVTGCEYTDIVCNDNNACTEDSCDPDTGCVFTSLSCDFVSPPLGFSLPEFLCPATIPTNEQLISLAGLECTCDDEPVITVPPHEVGTADGITTWEYTALCGSPECGTPVVGQFDNADCLPPCSCEPKAPNLCGCKGYPFPYALFERLGGGCNPLPGCDKTPVYEIDDSQVDYNTPGKVYPYTVICEGCLEPNDVKTGLIYIRNPLCGPTGSCICPSHCP
jgi:hypothetical protein